MLDTLLIRLILQPYWRLTRSQTLGVQAVVINQGGEILLIRHTYVRGWHLPGGGVERHEALPDALRRELAEEAGIQTRGDPQLHGIFSNFERSAGDHIAVYIVRNWNLIGTRSRSPEVLEQRFFSLKELPATLIDGARRRIAEIFEEHKISSFW